MQTDIFDVSGKNAVITGASSGIGRSIAELLYKKGANVAILGRRESRLEELSSALAAGGDHAVYPVVCDVKNEKNVESAVGKIIDRLGNIDILVNSAGITEKSSDITTHTRIQWENVIETNLSGTYLMCREAAKGMKQNHYGKIVNISSMAAFMGLANQVSYVAAKSGIIGFTKALAVELGKYDITVNAISPGYTQSEMTNIGSSGYRYFKSRSVLNDIARPEDIHGAVLLLASDASRFITGTVITVDGGVTANI